MAFDQDCKQERMIRPLTRQEIENRLQRVVAEVGGWSAEDGEADQIAFITYYKSEYGLHTVERREPLQILTTTDFGGPGPIIDFQAPLTHTFIEDNSRQKGAFENLFLEGRPPLNVGLTSNGDFLGGTQITFTDVLGDQQFSVLAYSVSQYRTLGVSYANLAGRMQFALQGFSQSLRANLVEHGPGTGDEVRIKGQGHGG